jgi:hypothetical protein
MGGFLLQFTGVERFERFGMLVGIGASLVEE